MILLLGRGIFLERDRARSGCERKKDYHRKGYKKSEIEIERKRDR